jgi:hypothetical protein
VGARAGRAPLVAIAMLAFALVVTGFAPVARAEPQTRKQQACIATVEKGFADIADARWKVLLRCAKRAARGNSFNACLDAPSKGVERARNKEIAAAQNNCEETPDFGVEGFRVVGDSGENAATGLFSDVFGADPNTVWIQTKQDKAGAVCQQSLAKSLQKCLRARADAFERCARAGLRSGEIVDAATLAECLDVDTSGATEGACAISIGKVVDDKCDSADVDLVDAFPGCNLTSVGRTLDGCADRSAACRACRGESAAGKLDATCAACAPEPFALAPAGAGAAAENLAIEDVGRDGFPDSATLTSSVFEVEPDGAAFDRPIVVALPIDPNTPDGTRIEVVRLDETAMTWTPVPGAFVAGRHAFVRTDHLSAFSTRANPSSTACFDTWRITGSTAPPPIHRRGAIQVTGATLEQESVVFSGPVAVALGSSWSSESCIAPVEGTFGEATPGGSTEGAWRDYSHPLVTPISSLNGGPFRFTIRSAEPDAARGPFFGIADPCTAPLDVFSYQLDVAFTSACTDPCQGETCNDADPCTDDLCDPADGSCATTPRTTCGADDAGICVQGTCTLAVPLDGTTSGTQSCAAIGLTCVDPLPVFEPAEAACLAFHPTAVVSKGLSGWQQSVWCDGDTGPACSPDPLLPRFDTCHDCPTCTEPVLTCEDTTSTDLSQSFVECDEDDPPK